MRMSGSVIVIYRASPVAADQRIGSVERWMQVITDRAVQPVISDTI